MAVIQKIRNKYGKLAGGIIALALVAFILMDAASGKLGDFFGKDQSIMKVDGQKIDQKTYQERIKEYETLTQMFNKGRTIDETQRAQIDEQALQFIIYETVVGEQCDKLGIQTTEAEKKELIYGANADQLVQQFQIEGQQIFMNEKTHQFEPARVKGFEEQLRKATGNADQIQKIQEQWDVVKGYVFRTNRINKFNSLFMNAAYSPKFIADQNMKDQGSFAGIHYVKIPYTAVNDKDIKITDADLTAYMQAHKAQFEIEEPTRSIEYVSFDTKPSAEDTDKALGTLSKLKAEFETTKENENFVNRNTDADQYRDAFVYRKEFQSRFADTIYKMPVGGVYGPYFEGGSYKLTKVVDKKEFPDSVKCRHILVKTKDGNNELLSDSAAKKKIDSIVAAIRGGANFDTMVAKYSDDDGSKKTGGQYTFPITQRDIEKTFYDFIFNGKTGENKVVHAENQNYSGYHYIEILAQMGSTTGEKMATVSKALFPGDNTVNAYYSKANEFAGKNSTSPAFDAAIKKENLDKRLGENVKVNDFTVTGIGPAREIVRWMYSHKVGEVSNVFTLDGRYIVAKLVSVQEKGLPATISETIRPRLEAAVKAEKKSEMLINKYKAMTTLDAIAQASGQPVQNADTVSLGGSFVPGLGNEPKVVGLAFSPTLKANQVSPGIKGQAGVYFISVGNKWTKPTDPMAMQMMGQQRKMQQQQMKNSMGQQLEKAINKKANVTYNAENL